LWLRQALAAVRGLRREPASEAERAFYRGKLATCRYFVRYELPKADHQLALIQSLDRTCLDMAPEEFAG
jgi:butyryl-CoA dehydrogenase